MKHHKEGYSPYTNPIKNVRQQNIDLNKMNRFPDLELRFKRFK